MATTELLLAFVVIWMVMMSSVKRTILSPLKALGQAE
jgi:hypothetical protein